jgi:hypothetical protein
MKSSSTELCKLLTTPSNDLLYSFITPRYGSGRKHRLSTAEKACLLIRCLAMDVLLLRALAPAGMCLPSRCLAMGLNVTIFCRVCTKQADALQKLERSLAGILATSRHLKWLTFKEEGKTLKFRHLSFIHVYTSIFWEWRRCLDCV